MVAFENLIQQLDALAGPPHTPARTEAAIAVCAELLAQRPEDAGLHASMGSLLVRLERWAESLPHLAAALRALPDHPHLRASAGLACFHQRRFAEAAEHFARRLQLGARDGRIVVDAQNTEYASLLGTSYIHLGAFEKAASLFKAVINERAQALAGPGANVHAPLLPAAEPSPRTVARILYLPVEVKAREFASKLLIAAAAAAAGFTVVVGSTWNMLKASGRDLPPGVILFKTLNHLDARNMDQARGRHLIAALDEESFGRSADDVAVRLNVHPDALARTDLVLLQGEAHAALIRRLFPESKAPLAVTGAPRADVIALGLDAGDLDPPLQPGYILICLMSGNVNGRGRSFAVCAQTTLALGGVPINSPLGRAYVALFEDATAFELAMMPQIAEVARRVADAFPDRTIVVRPHPVEDELYWRDALGARANITVRSDGALTDWLPGAAAMVYVSGCGAGLEGYLAGLATVRFEGDGSVAVPGTGISSQLGLPARTADEVIAALRTAKGAVLGSRGDVIGAYLARPAETAAVAVTAQLSRLLATVPDGGRAPEDVRQVLDAFASRSDTFVPTAFHARKFPPTGLSEFRTALIRAAKALDLPSPRQVHQANDNVFVVEPSDD